MELEPAHDVEQLVVDLSVALPELDQRHRVADPRHHILALCIGQVVAVDTGCPRRWIPGEGDPGARALPEIAESHDLHVDRCAEIVRDALAAPIEPGTIGVPRPEDREDGEVELLPWILREVATGLVDDDLLVRRDELLERGHRDVDVGDDARLGLDLVECTLEEVPVDVEHRLAEHLDQPAVGIPGEALVIGDASHALDAGVVEPDVEDRLHHARHGEARTGPHGDEQRIIRVTQSSAHPILEPVELSADLPREFGRLLSGLEIGPARLRSDREARRYRQAQARHLGEVGALAAEQIRLATASASEVIDVGGRHSDMPPRRNRLPLGTSVHVPQGGPHHPPLTEISASRTHAASAASR